MKLPLPHCSKVAALVLGGGAGGEGIQFLLGFWGGFAHALGNAMGHDNHSPVTPSHDGARALA
ncbi:MAG: hypothetical protein ACKVOE_05495 [Rickettsiales bacterium]